LSRAQGSQLYHALLSDSTLDQFEVYKTLVWERGWGGGGSPMRTSEGGGGEISEGGGEISSFSRCAIQGFQEEGAGQVSWRQTTPGCVCVQAKSSVLSELSGLENVLFNDFIDDELDSEDVSEQRVFASLPDSVPIESEEERAAREEDEMCDVTVKRKRRVRETTRGKHTRLS